MVGIDKYFEMFVEVKEEERVPDGYGGWKVIYIEGEPFRAGILVSSENERHIAEQRGIKAEYMILTNQDNILKHNTIIKRLDNNTLYRVTGFPIDGTPPKVSGFKHYEVYASNYDK